MSTIALISATEAGGVLEHDLESFGIDVAASPLAAADEAFAAAEIDAYVVEAPQATDELRRIVEAAGRQPKTPLILVLRPDQLQALDPSWAVDDFVLLPVAAQELILRLRRSIWRRRGIDA